MSERNPIPEGCNTITIIGGGFSGSVLAVQLLRRAGPHVSVVLIERLTVPGRGVAYGTQFEGHLLNVRAKNMSAYPDRPDHLVKWAQRHYSSSVKPDDFLPRTIFGQYISSQLREAAGLSTAKFRCIQDEAIGIEHMDGRSLVRLRSGQTVMSGKIVLALGNFPPGDLRIPGRTASSTRYVANPWAAKAIEYSSNENSVLLVGSGLTSVDVVLEMRARGFEGIIHMLSRRGLLPQRHAAIPFPPFPTDDAPRTARGLLRLIRLQVQNAEKRGSNWRAVIDSLRPATQKIWRSMPRDEQRRFLRHLRTYWDVHRHRIAERIADQLNLQLRSGQIQMHAGRITQYAEANDGVEITYRMRKNGGEKTLRVDRVVNCTGPEGDFRSIVSPLLSDLVQKKLARPDELFLGLDVADDGAVVDAQGLPSDSIYALGPLRKGKLWESTAVPELRAQAAELANILVDALQPNAALTMQDQTEAVASTQP